VKIFATMALAFVTTLSGSCAYAQTEHPNVHHHTHQHYPSHAVHHHYVARAPVVTSERAGAEIGAAPFPTDPMFRPYADPGQGDEDGLSQDPDDCMKGCIGGNPQ
jgi:hypothetical protein